mgnify:CR=1 FL=1
MLIKVLFHLRQCYIPCHKRSRKGLWIFWLSLWKDFTLSLKEILTVKLMSIVLTVVLSYFRQCFAQLYKRRKKAEHGHPRFISTDFLPKKIILALMKISSQNSGGGGVDLPTQICPSPWICSVDKFCKIWFFLVRHKIELNKIN